MKQYLFCTVARWHLARAISSFSYNIVREPHAITIYSALSTTWHVPIWSYHIRALCHNNPLQYVLPIYLMGLRQASQARWRRLA